MRKRIILFLIIIAFTCGFIKEFKKIKENEIILPEINNLNHWFTDDVLKQLGYIYYSIQLIADNDIKDFHTKMWIFCHGIATLVANGTVKLTDNQIQELLSDEFQALMLLEENPNNKWVLNKKEEN